MPSFSLVAGTLSLPILKKLIASDDSISLSDSCDANINASARYVQQIINDKKIVYGINTGFGALAKCAISESNLRQLQYNLIVSHATGTGEFLADEIVRIILLLKINSLSLGYSGVRLELIKGLIALYNKGVYPCIPHKGSVGASGDLAPLAHMSLPLIGIGKVRYQGQIMEAIAAFDAAKLSIIELAPKEGLALINGLQVSTALLIKAFWLTDNLLQTALIAGSIAIDAAGGSDAPFDEQLQKIRRQPAQLQIAGYFRKLLEGSAIRESHRDCARVQDPYSLRCQPQIMGAVLQQMKYVYHSLENEVNAVTDNPIIFAEKNCSISGGNFHGEIIAMAADNLALAIAEIGANSERRIALLVDQAFSGLPAFLVKDCGLNSGFMIAHVTAAACASDNKALSHPHSVDSFPTSANQEDHVSMATNAANRLFKMIENTTTILAIELLAGCQGLEFRKPRLTSKVLQKIYNNIREVVPAMDQDRYFAPEISLLKDKIMRGEFFVNTIDYAI